MGGKCLTCTTRLLADPNRIDSCRNRAITTHDSGLAGLGSGGVTSKPDVEKRRLTENVASPFQAEPRHPEVEENDFSLHTLIPNGHVFGAMS